MCVCVYLYIYACIQWLLQKQCLLFCYVRPQHHRWYGNSSWIFLPIFHYNLLPCDTVGSLIKWCLTWKCILMHIKKKCVVDFLYVEKNYIHWHSLILVECFLRQWVLEVWGGGWCISTMAIRDRRVSGSPPLVQILQCGMQALAHSWWRYIADGGDYVER